MSVHPRASLILLAYRQADFIRAAVEGALAQDYPNLEILISDDCSPDETFETIKDAVRGYDGPHALRVMRMPCNVGLARHLQTLVGQAEGELLVLAAGDDISLSGRTSALVKAWLAAGRRPAVLYSDCRMINLAGEMIVARSPVMRREPPTFEQACRGDLDVHGATSAVTASIFRRFPPLDPGVVHEDRVLPFRAMLLGGVVKYVDDALVDYRFEGGISRMPKDTGQARLLWLNGQRRGLADARQRLADLRVIGTNDARVEHLCRATIRNHEIAVEFGEAPPARYEFLLLTGLFRGAKAAPLVRIYLRQRAEMLGVLRWTRALRDRLRHVRLSVAREETTDAAGS